MPRDLILHQYEIKFDTHISGVLFLESRLRSHSDSQSDRLANQAPAKASANHCDSLSSAATIDLRTYFALILLTQPSSRAVPTLSRKPDLFIRTFGADSEAAITDAIVDSICEVFEDRLLFRNPEFDRWHDGKSLFKEKVKYYVANKDAVRFCLPAFPCKSSNCDKVASVRPDGAEFEALTNLYTFALAVRTVYPAGCVVEIVSDGHVFSDCVGTDDDLVSEYTRQLQVMAGAVRSQVQTATGGRCDGLVTFQGLHDILFPMKWTRIFFRSEFAQADNVQHPVNTRTTLQDSTNRGLLLHSCSACHETLEQVIHRDINSSLTLLYRGFSRFMLDDLKFHPDGRDKSKSQRKKLSEKVALEMMRRNQAYSHLVELVMPHHVRISIHAHNNSGPKFAISMLPKDRFKPLASFDGLRLLTKGNYFEASHHLHIPTPWHNALVQIDGEDTTYVCKSGLVKAELEREDSIWLAKSGYVHDHERGGRYVLYRAETTPRHSRCVLSSKAEVEDLYG